MKRRLGQWFTQATYLHIAALAALVIAMAGPTMSAPRAELVMDMRSGEVVLAKNADTPLHPASLTKMMTLYITFEAVEHGEISLDEIVTISKHAASEPPSKLGLRPGQKIAIRYLIRAAAVKSANDAATALGEAIAGSEAAFARRMNRTAKALGMTRTHFKNAHGLTEQGHLSTARDMTILGRHLFFDYPGYYHLFSRKTIDVPGRTLPNTNRRFLSAYKGADGIKTGFTNAAGFNLVASAERGGKRVIATMFGGTSTQARNARVAELLDYGFSKVPASVAVRRPARPGYQGNAALVVVVGPGDPTPHSAGRIIRQVRAPERSIRPRPRPGTLGTARAPAEAVVATLEAGIDAVVDGLAEDAVDAAVDTAVDAAVDAAVDDAGKDAALAEATISAMRPPPPKPDLETAADIAAAAPARIVTASATPVAAEPGIILDAVELVAKAPARPEVVMRMSTSGGRHWGVSVGHYPTRDAADRMLIRTALSELASLGEALRKVVKGPKGFDANFVGLTQEGAAFACRRLEARNTACTVLGPPS